MAAFTARLLASTNLIPCNVNTIGYGLQQVRNFIGARMKRDMKRRKTAEDWAPLRVRVLSLKRNDILPVEIKNIANEEMDKIPRTTALRQLTNRCVVTSRGKGVVCKWRVSRIIFRHLADYNKLSGVQRAIW